MHCALCVQPFSGRHMAAVVGLIWRPISAVFKLLAWGIVWMLSAASLHLRKCTTQLTRLCSARFCFHGSGYATLSRKVSMATSGEGTDDKLVEKIAKNVVQNVKTKEVRHRDMIFIVWVILELYK